MSSLDVAKKILEDKGELIPTFIGDCRDGRLYLFGKFRNDEEKFQFLSLVRAVFAVFEVDNYSVLNEAWMTISKDLPDEILKGEKKVRDLEEKVECITEMKVSFEKNSSTIVPFRRNEKDEIVFLENEKVESENVQGTFTELLTEKEERKKINAENKEAKEYIKENVLPLIGKLEVAQ